MTDRVVQVPAQVAPAQTPYGPEFDLLAAAWANLENIHDQCHPDRSHCGGVGGCTMMAAAVDLQHKMIDALRDWRQR